MVTVATLDALTVKGPSIRGAADGLDDLNAINATSAAVRRTPERIQGMITTRHLLPLPRATLDAEATMGRGSWSVDRGAERPMMTTAARTHMDETGRSAVPRRTERPWRGLELRVRSG